MSFFDATCPKCKRRFGWSGKLKDKPACPKCGHKQDIDLEELKRIEEFEENLRQRMLRDDDLGT